MRLTDAAHDLLRPHLRDGGFVIDGTAGQGHDTLFLAQAVGPAGLVAAFDPQPAALEATRLRVEGKGIGCALFDPVRPNKAQVLLFACGHEKAPVLLGGFPGPQAVVLNLGYLPGGDHAITTQAASTEAFLSWASESLAPGGVLSVLAYRAHPGGEEEAVAVAAFVSKLAAKGWSLESRQGPPGRLPSPVLHFLVKPAKAVCA